MADPIAPIGAHTRLQRDREHGQLWLTCLDCGAQWHDDPGLEQVSDGDGSCDEQADESATHWGYGSGMVGCLFDNGPCFVETKEQAIDGALFPFEDSDLPDSVLSDARNTLERGETYYFPREHQAAAGAHMLQIWEESGPCPDADD